MKSYRCIILLLFLGLILSPAVTKAEYKIGPEDVLDISFWQKDDLNTTVRVSKSGKITLDVIGEIVAAGKSTKELQEEIAREISRLNKNVTQAVVRISIYNYQFVFVSGQVIEPGKITFEEIPDLWTIINEAGGINENGDLSRVTIIRGGDGAGEVITVNVSDAIAKGEINKLPKIRRQDTIEISRTPSGIYSGDLSKQINRKNVLYAIGAVNTPGLLTFEENVDILEALTMAGGPSSDADLSKVIVITRDGYYAQTYLIDLNKYAETGAIPRYIMQREDALIIPQKSTGGLFGIDWITLGTMAGVVTSGILIYNQVFSNDE